MSENKSRLISVGEVMIELSRGPEGRYGLAFGGDTFNTAVYLARAGIPVAYATALGDDPYSDGILALASAEGNRHRPDAARAGPHAGPLFDRDRSERRAPVLLLARHVAGARAVRAAAMERAGRDLVGARMIYFSGVTLSLYSNVGLGRFLQRWRLPGRAG